MGPGAARKGFATVLFARGKRRADRTSGLGSVSSAALGGRWDRFRVPLRDRLRVRLRIRSDLGPGAVLANDR